MPISTTAISVSSASAMSAIGTPISVFWLPGVPSTRAPAARSIATRMSLVVVLPVAPVMPTTFAPSCVSARRPAACSTSSGDFATITGLRIVRRSPSSHRHADSLTTAAAAPSRRASARVQPAIVRLATQADEQRPGHDLARVDERAVDLVGRRARRHVHAAGGGLHDLVGSEPHRLASSTSRATSPIVEGAHHPVALLAALVSLACDDHDVAGRGALRGERDRAAAVGLDNQLSPVPRRRRRGSRR